MKFYFTHDWKKKSLGVRNFDIIPSFLICLWDNYTFESFRISWLGFMLGIYNGDDNKEKD